ncbi:hypothetical protein [Pontibacter rugosus]|uniref:Uncharacterized protein n=1 Tax=Pontibacter rugosus TaxID=1745966 RepID=A0ABW3STN0_9BACT
MNKSKFILLFICLPLLYSCNSSESETATSSEQSLNDYRNYVSEFEQDSLSEVEMRALEQAEEDNSRWETEKTNLQETYNERRAVVEQNLEELDEQQRAEVNDLDQRYNRALQQRERQYAEAGRRSMLRRDLLGLEVKNPDMSDVTAENIASVYDRFIATLAQNTAQYEQRDWNQIEGWWNSLNNRFQTLEDELDPSAKNSIEQAQNRYREIRENSNIAGR